MFKPVGHKSTEFAGMYAGMCDMADLNYTNFDTATEANKRMYGFNPTNYCHATKQPVLPYRGFISSLPAEAYYPLIGPGYYIIASDTNGHAVSSDMPIPELASKLTNELRERGLIGPSESIRQVTSIGPEA